MPSGCRSVSKGDGSVRAGCKYTRSRNMVTLALRWLWAELDDATERSSAGGWRAGYVGDAVEGDDGFSASDVARSEAEVRVPKMPTFRDLCTRDVVWVRRVRALLRPEVISSKTETGKGEGGRMFKSTNMPSVPSPN
mmetsp:Transcript_81880/g.136875  ORF Transcript_81880/g.136875 Transcript_81880/m.136875 type:complete len:137 (-) Transcript_81880:127-537(-)